MRALSRLTLILICCLGPISRAETRQPTQQFDAPELPKLAHAYEATTSVQTRGEAQRVTVKLGDWVIRNRQRARLPETGTLLVQMRGGGPVITVVNGTRTERHDDEWFTVPNGAELIVETGNDTALLTVLVLKR